MLNGKPIKLPDQFPGFTVKFLQRGIPYLVLAAKLLYQKLRIADDLQGAARVLGRIFKRGKKRAVFRVIIGLMAEIFAEFSDLVSILVSDHYPVPGWTGITASATVNVGNQVRGGRSFAWFGEQIPSAWTRRVRRHERSLQPWDRHSRVETGASPVSLQMMTRN